MLQCLGRRSPPFTTVVIDPSTQSSCAVGVEFVRKKWRQDLLEEGAGEHLDPTFAQVLAPKLMAEIELVWAER